MSFHREHPPRARLFESSHARLPLCPVFRRTPNGYVADFMPNRASLVRTGAVYDDLKTRIVVVVSLFVGVFLGQVAEMNPHGRQLSSEEPLVVFSVPALQI